MSLLVGISSKAEKGGGAPLEKLYPIAAQPPDELLMLLLTWQVLCTSTDVQELRQQHAYCSTTGACC